MTFVTHVLGIEPTQPYDHRTVYNEFALMINAQDLDEAKSRFAAWHILLTARKELELQTHHIYCNSQCNCPKSIKAAKLTLTNAIRQVQFPILTPAQGETKP